MLHSMPAHLQRSCGPENTSAFPGELRELCKHLSLCNPQEREHSFQAARVCLIRGLHSAGVSPGRLHLHGGRGLPITLKIPPLSFYLA